MSRGFNDEQRDFIVRLVKARFKRDIGDSSAGGVLVKKFLV
jgi:hypothetical protein